MGLQKMADITELSNGSRQHTIQERIRYNDNEQSYHSASLKLASDKMLKFFAIISGTTSNSNHIIFPISSRAIKYFKNKSLAITDTLLFPTQNATKSENI
jgi:hypothetical protein